MLDGPLTPAELELASMEDHEHQYVLTSNFDLDGDDVYYTGRMRCDRCPAPMGHAYEEGGYHSCSVCGELACYSCATKGKAA